MSQRVQGGTRKGIALLVLAVMAGLAWWTMDAGRTRMLVFILLGGFALRVLLTGSGSRYDKADTPAGQSSDGK